MRKLIVIGLEQYVRNLVLAGAFDDIVDEDTYWVAGGNTTPLPVGRGTLAGTVKLNRARRVAYRDLRLLMLASYRDRSETQRIKLEVQGEAAQDLIRRSDERSVRRAIKRTLEELGPNEKLAQIVADVEPDIVIAPSGGVDPLVYDAARCAREAGSFSLALIFNWDNLSSKGAFPVRPDHLAVVGPQSVEHAWSIHRYPADQVSVLGGPYIDHHFHHAPGSTKSPFPFPYVLFAGCYMPFDERTSLELLNRHIEDAGLDLKIVYRPHPQRRPRLVDDRVEDETFRHVVIDPQIRDDYLRYYGGKPDWSRPLPALDHYPALLENAEFVICPLSTMVLESTIFERRVLVIAYHDHIHTDSPGIVVGYDHFKGMEAIPGLTMCLEQEDLVEQFSCLLAAEPPPPGTLRDSVAPWIYHDERPYSERLAELVGRLGREHRLGDGVAYKPPAQPVARAG